MEKKEILDFLHTRLDIGMTQYAVLCGATKLTKDITRKPEPLFTPESCIDTACRLIVDKVYKLLEIENMKDKFRVNAYSKDSILWLNMESDNNKFTVGLSNGGSFVFDVIAHIKKEGYCDIELLYSPENDCLYLKEDRRGCTLNKNIKNSMIGNFYNNCYGLFSEIRKEKERLKHKKNS